MFTLATTQSQQITDRLFLSTSATTITSLEVIDLGVPVHLRDIYILIGIIGFTGNLLVFSMLVKIVSKAPNKTESLLLHQTVIDGITSLWVIVAAAFPSPTYFAPYSSRIWNEIVCRVWGTQLPMWMCFSASCFNLLAITFEAYCEIVHPIFHKVRLHKMRTAIPVCLVWLCSICCNVPAYVPDTGIVDGYCLAWGIFPNAIASAATGVAVLLYYLIIPALLMVGCFCHMAFVMHKKMTQAAPQAAVSTFSHAKLSILKTLVLFGLTYICCWSYNVWVWSLSFFNAIDLTFYTLWEYHLSVLLLFLSCSINPFIYAFNHKKIKTQFRNIWVKCFGVKTNMQTDGHSGGHTSGQMDR